MKINLNYLFIFFTYILITVLSSPINLNDIKNLVNTKLFVKNDYNSILDFIDDIKKALNNGAVDVIKLEEIFNNLFNITVIDPIENLIESTERKKFSVKKNGFYGELFEPENNNYPGKALILCTGSDGDFNMVRTLSKGLSNNGITVLGLGYFKVPGTPSALKQVPLEYIEKAGNYLKSEGFEKIGMWGFSAGSVYSLLGGVYFPDLISLVVASSPSNFVFQCYGTPTFVNKSAFSYKGKQIPYEPNANRFDVLKTIYLMIRDLEPNTLYLFDNLEKTASENHLIPVEKMKARVLFFSGKLDKCWPSESSSQMMMKRLQSKNYTYPYEHISCEYGGHVMAPFRTSMDVMMRANRDYPEEANEYREQHLNKLLEVFNEW
ncbi:hypothetical protein PIROE2DRAFT_1724 [Piromyces sp. E2]|nr:hypothetical protein PIROE2DRAFT_1724 [Piromyces sp. E2]|eukprot:OUM70297.1 hypothetical protein PIROE2DRAFT_1724 [Piromyces sp. E2]